jgi:hypothetical protein
VRPARKADNLTAICEPICKKIWEPRRLTNLWPSTACYRDSFTLTFFSFGVLLTQYHRDQCVHDFLTPNLFKLHRNIILLSSLVFKHGLFSSILKLYPGSLLKIRVLGISLKELVWKSKLRTWYQWLLQR